LTIKLRLCFGFAAKMIIFSALILWQNVSICHERQISLVSVVQRQF